MAKWVRVGDLAGKVKVSFEVKHDDYPELFNWLCTLPYGETSQRVRDILAQAVSTVARRKPNGIEHPILPSLQIRPAVRPVDPSVPDGEPSPPDPSDVAVSEEAAKLLLEMGENF